MALPTGTVTCLFTDIEGSARIFQKNIDRIDDMLKRHNAILRHAIESHDGYVFQVIGDAFCATFQNPLDALKAAIGAQRQLHAEPWQSAEAIRVRIGLYTGEVRANPPDDPNPYSGYLTFARVQRIMSAGHGGQILMGQSTYDSIRANVPDDIFLQDLGERRLKDLVRPEHLYQVCVAGLPREFPLLRTLDARPNNLPVQLTSFVGRQHEMTEIMNLLSPSVSNGTHLLTLVGTGGAGKTRLSLQVAADLIDEFDHGVWFVELAPLSNAGLVPQAIAAALGVREDAKCPIIETLCDHLRDKTLLIVLDNCEHLVDACALVVERLLRAAPGLRILTSSREALRISGEATYRVPSLTNPDPQHLPPIETLTQYEAIRLFVDRASAVMHGFTLDSLNAPSITQICCRLDGIPLAIELAAARTKSLSVAEIAARLDDRFHLLVGGSRTALPRQRTLRALVDWSYDLLSEPERILWQRLAVFVGGWDLHAAEEICADEKIPASDILDLLTHLVDKSLVLSDKRANDTRYGMLETLRQYSYSKLTMDEQAMIRQRHGDFFLGFAEHADGQLQTPNQKEWFVRMETEHDNLRAASAFFLDAQPACALRLANTLGHFWQTRGHIAEARATIEKSLQAAREPSAEELAKGLRWQGLFAYRQGDYVAARAPLLQSVTLLRQQENKRGLAGSLTILGLVAWSHGEYNSAQNYLQECLALFHEIDDARGLARALTNLSNLSMAQGRFDDSRRYSEESVAACRELEDKLGLAYSLNNLGVITEAQGDIAAAQRSYEESIAIFRELDEKLAIGIALNSLAHVNYLQKDFSSARHNYRASLLAVQQIGDKRGVAYCLEGFAKLALSDNRIDRAATLMASAENLRQAIGSPLNPSEQIECDQDLACARKNLDAAAFDRAWAQGLALTMEQAIVLALE